MGTTHQNRAFTDATYDRAKQYANQPAVNLHEYACGTIYTSPALGPDPLPGHVTKWHHPCNNGTHHRLHAAQDLQRDVDDEHIHDIPEKMPSTGPRPGTPEERPAGDDLDRIIHYNTRDNGNIAAAIRATYYLVPRDELPTVPPNAITASAPTVGTFTFAGAQDRDLVKIRRDLASLAAWAEYLEQQQTRAEEEARQAAADAARLQARRDTLTRDLTVQAHGTTAAAVSYANLGPVTQAAIDWIIALEEHTSTEGAGA